MKAYLRLEDGQLLVGTHHGQNKDVFVEVVFNTSMTGYQEILTDPSYKGQGVILTYPLIGNYGVNDNYDESSKVHLDALITHELSFSDSNYNSEGNLDDYLKAHHVFAISDIDTRTLTRKIREKGTMMGYLSTSLDKVNSFDFNTTRDEDFVFQVSRKSMTHYDGKRFRIALMDFGMKQNILRFFLNQSIEVDVYPSDTLASTILEGNYDGVMLSNGPGDPKTCTAIIEQLKILVDSNIPIFAICLGHQLLALAHGFDTYKLKYGHRGANHPVKDLRTGKVYLSSQNHGYVVDESTVDKSVATPLFYNVNDGSNEGLLYLKHPILSVQFHPEACPGPQDTSYLFEEFYKMMEERKHA